MYEEEKGQVGKIMEKKAGGKVEGMDEKRSESKRYREERKVKGRGEGGVRRLEMGYRPGGGGGVRKEEGFKGRKWM